MLALQGGEPEAQFRSSEQGAQLGLQAVEAGVKISGCTVHFVDEGTDSGPIILQKTVPVYFEDNARTLQEKVLAEEHKALPEALKLIVEDRIKICERKVLIKS